MRTRLSILILAVLLAGSAPLHAAPSDDFRMPDTVMRILRFVRATGGRLSPPIPAPTAPRLVPKATGDRLSPPIPAPAPSTAPRCAPADCRT